MYERGLHASATILEALWRAPGLRLHRVELDVIVDRDSYGFYVARRRKILASFDVSTRSVMRLAVEAACLAAWCARSDVPSLRSALEAVDRGATLEACDWLCVALEGFRFTSYANMVAAQLVDVAEAAIKATVTQCLCEHAADAVSLASKVAGVCAVGAITNGPSLVAGSAVVPTREARRLARLSACKAVLACMEQRAIELFTGSTQ
jgi:hypothetical protein